LLGALSGALGAPRGCAAIRPVWRAASGSR